LKLDARIVEVRILGGVVDPLGIEQAAATLDTVDDVVFLEKQFREVGSVLPGDTSDQGDLSGRCV
jgi:hypothetical protein